MSEQSGGLRHEQCFFICCWSTAENIFVYTNVADNQGSIIEICRKSDGYNFVSCMVITIPAWLNEISILKDAAKSKTVVLKDLKDIFICLFILL